MSLVVTKIVVSVTKNIPHSLQRDIDEFRKTRITGLSTLEKHRREKQTPGNLTQPVVALSIMRWLKFLRILLYLEFSSNELVLYNDKH